MNRLQLSPHRFFANGIIGTALLLLMPMTSATAQQPISRDTTLTLPLGTLTPGPLRGIDAIAPMPIDTEAPFFEIDNQQGVWLSPHYPPHRPMAFEGNVLYALNNHDSRLQIYTDQSVNTKQPVSSFRVPWLPVSLALWHDPTAGNALRVLVVSRGSWCVTMLDPATGETLAVHRARHPVDNRLLAEPGDIIVDDNTNKAYVSFSADDMVVELDLQGGSIADLRHFSLAGKHPIFLAFDDGGNVLVTPTLSGNNSVAHQNPNNIVDFEPFPRRVIDTTDSTLVVPGGGLPDQDVFRIDLGTGTVEAVATAVGTTLFAHAINPITGDHWTLNTEAHNKDPNKRGMHAIAGDIVANRLSIATLPATGQAPVTPHKIVNLDKFTNTGGGNFVYDANGSFEPTKTMGQPYSLAFLDSGFALIAALLTNRVHVLDMLGNFIYSLDLNPGDIPRQVLYHGNTNSIVVYNWGSNTIDLFVANGSTTPWLELELGHDPTPPAIQQGRAIAYSATRSEHNNASCLSCHIDGRSDHVVWDIANVSDDPSLANPLDGMDDKGPMLTQTFAGIKRAGNFHWRGEQRNNLRDFNPAFIELLGSATMLNESPGGEFDQFEKFIFSIANPANPRQHRLRVVSDSVQPALIPGFPASQAASEGQQLFIDGCAGCHSFPMSTSNDNTADGAVFNNLNTHQIFFKVSPFQEMWRREFDADPITPGLQLTLVDWVDTVPDLPDASFYNTLGAGLSHAGLASGIQHFVLFFGFTLQQNSSISAFIDQWDSGLAGMAHRAVLIDRNASPQDISLLLNYLIPQARDMQISGIGQALVNGDLIAYGTSDLGTGPQFMEWVYDRRLQQFLPSDTSLAPRNASFFVNAAATGAASNVFIGVPFAMGTRFGVDYDNDGLFNGDETNSYQTDPFLADHDGDSFLDGHEVDHGANPNDNLSVPTDSTPPSIVNNITILWKTTKVARVVFETSEPTTATINWSDNAGASGTEISESPSIHHSLVLVNLTPSAATAKVTVNGTVSVVDRGNNQITVALPSFDTDIRQGIPSQVKLDQLAYGPWGIALPPGTGMAGSATARVVERQSGATVVPKSGYVSMARIFRNSQLETNVTNSVPNFTYNGLPYPLLNGPYIVSTVSNGSGKLAFNFGLPNAAPGDEICLVIEVVASAPPAWNPLNPTLPDNALDLWSFPDTPKEARKICIP